MLAGGDCSIYGSRPVACGQFDCRVLAAAGCQLDGRWSGRVNERVGSWRFSHSTSDSEAAAQSVKAAAAFIVGHAHLFPGSRVPTHPLQLSILALKVHSVFLPGRPREPKVTVQRVIAASRQFEGGQLVNAEPSHR